MDDIHLVGSQRKAAENTASKYAYKFFLAALADLYDDCPDPDTFPFSEDKGYEVFDHLEADDPPKAMKHPITIMREAKSMLGALFACIVSVVNDTGKVPAGGVKAHLANARAARADQVIFMINTAEALWPTINSGHLERDFESVACFREKLEALVGDKANVDPGADELARIFVRFLKCIVWFTANFAVEAKVTLNGKLLRSVIRCFGCLPGVVFDEGMTDFFDNQLAWIEEHDTAAKPAKAEAAPKAKAGAAPKAKAGAAPKAKAAPKAEAGAAPKAEAEAAPKAKAKAAPKAKAGAAPKAKAGPAPKVRAGAEAPAEAEAEAEATPDAGVFQYDDLLTGLGGL